MQFDDIYRKFFESSQSMIVIADMQTDKILMANKAAMTYYGYSLLELKKMKLSELSIDDEETIRARRREAAISKLSYYSLKHKTAQGYIRDVQLYCSPVNFKSRLMLYCIIHDVTDTEKIKKDQELELFKKIIENNSEEIMITDNRFNISWVNNRFIETTGITKENAIGKNPKDLKTCFKNKKFYDEFWITLLLEGKWEGEVWNRNKFGVDCPEYLSIFSIYENNEVENYVGMFKDLSSEKRIQSDMRFLSQTDSLTGLLNRSSFKDTLQKKVRENKDINFAVILIDIINFKELNDSLGQDFGDKVLINCADILTEHYSDKYIISRYGSDEFLIATSHLESSSEIFLITKDIKEKIEASMEIRDSVVNVFIRQGVAFYPGDSVSVLEIIRMANVASYYNKEKNIKLTFYSKEMDRRIMDRFGIANSVKKAIENDEFFMVYQPIFNSTTLKADCAEALIRWNDPVKGVISPNEFIPIIENTGQINALGYWILKQVAMDIKMLVKKGYEVPKIAINISLKQLENPDFCFDSLNIFEFYGIDLSKIEFEITETIISGNLKTTLENIEFLNASGITISMDDFGTGYSSLGHLKNLPIKKLKIDKIFIDDVPFDQRGIELLKAIVSMAKNLKLETVAEGVENLNQIQMIKDMGCEYIQGYYYSKPIDIEQLQSFLNIRPEL